MEKAFKIVLDILGFFLTIFIVCYLIEVITGISIPIIDIFRNMIEELRQLFV